MCEHLALIKKHFPVPKRYLRDGAKNGTRGLFWAFSHDVTSVILVTLNKETAAKMVFQTISMGFEPFSYAKTFFCSNKFA